jgi:hypothetical protein
MINQAGSKVVQGNESFVKVVEAVDRMRQERGE